MQVQKESDSKFESKERILAAIALLREKGIIQDARYWERNAVKGSTVRGEYAALLLCRAADQIGQFSELE